MSSLFYKYEGPEITPASVWSTCKRFAERHEGLSPTKEDIVKMEMRDKSYVKKLQTWVNEQVSKSIETALEINFLKEEKNGTVRYRALEI